MNVYFISGLGADKRAFGKIKLPEHCTPFYIDWLVPLNNESLSSYSKRMGATINLEKPFVLVGLSFGGIIVSELLKEIVPSKAIVVSSITSKGQIPWYFKLLKALQVHKVFPYGIFKRTNWLVYWFFGVRTVEEKRLLDQIFNDTETNFLRWSINEILNWSNSKRLPGIIHIHGDNDHLFPLRNVNADIVIKDGGHFMVYTKSEELSACLAQILNK